MARDPLAGESFDVQVASIRKVKWDSFQPNFFIVFAPGVLEGTVGTYLTSAYFALKDAGVPIYQALDHASQKSVYFYDPDGYTLELFQPPK